MRALRILVARIRALFRRDIVAGEINEELQFHLKARVEQYEEEGLTHDAAARKARARVGNLALHQDHGYDVRGGGFMETVIQDVRHSVRLLAKQRGFALVAILTIALGIGASTAIFSVIDAAILRPLPYPNPEQLVSVHVAQFLPSFKRVHTGNASVADIRAWQGSNRVFSHIAAHRWNVNLLVDDGEPERLSIASVTEEYFGVYGVAPIHGRGFSRDDMRLDAPAVALVSHGHWQRRFGGRLDALGRTIRLEGIPTVIVGILPPAFQGETPIWRPLRSTAAQESDRRGGPEVYARLRSGVTFEDASRELTPLIQVQPPEHRVTVVVRSEVANLASINETTVGIISGAVALVLLIACVNVAGLLLARGATRQPELAVRASLGAGRLRLLRQLLTEGLVLAVAGGLAGVLVAWVTLDLIVANMPMRLSADNPARLSLPVLGASFVLMIVTGLLFGLVPAIRMSKVQLGAVMAKGTRRHGSALSRRSGQGLITLEIALAVVLLAGAGLMIRSFARMVTTDVGFSPGAILTLEAWPVDPKDQHAYYTALVDRVRALPGVEVAGAVDHVPLKGSSVSVSAVLDTGRRIGGGLRTVLPGYAEAIGMRLSRGRFLTEADMNGPPAAIINESAARLVSADGALLGRRIDFRKISYEIVGVVGDVRHHDPSSPPQSEIFLLFTKQAPLLMQTVGLTVVVRPRAGVPGLAEALRQAALAVGPRAIVGDVRSGDEWFSDSVVTPRQQTVLLSLLGGLGLLLTLVGVLGMTAYAVARRTQEIGVRMAFGARPGQVVGRMVRDSAIPVVIGVAIGLGGAVAATRVIKTFLFETTPTDPLTLAAVAVTLAIAGTLAAWIPARRAARVDPVTALRTE